MPASVRMVAAVACSRVAAQALATHFETSRHRSWCDRVLPEQIKHRPRFDTKLVNAPVDIPAVDRRRKAESRISDSCSEGAFRRGMGRMIEQTAFP